MTLSTYKVHGFFCIYEFFFISLYYLDICNLTQVVVITSPKLHLDPFIKHKVSFIISKN